MSQLKTIYLQHPHNYNKDELEPTVIALGYFDGVHLGHQQVINTAIQMADNKGLKSAVMTFDPHPAVVLGKRQEALAITPLPIKEKVLSELGVDILYIVRFNREFSELSPQQFIDEYMIGLAAKHVVAGFDYTYGRFGKGTMETIGSHSRGEFDYTVVEKVEFHNRKISSTMIREQIKAGEVESLPDYLGRYYEINGTVITGEKRGRTIGFPTANLAITEEYLLPKKGVYAARLKVGDEWFNGVLNIGYKPTFHKDLEAPTIEVHLFDFDRDIYGEQVILEWRKRIRDEKKFDSIDDLIAQIKRDKSEAINYFKVAL